MRRPIAALLSCLVSLISQSAGATNCHVKKVGAVCQFNTLKLRGHYVLGPPFDVAYADAGGDQNIDQAGPRAAQTAHRSENRLAMGVPLQLYRSSAGKIEHETAQPAQWKKKLTRAIDST